MIDRKPAAPANSPAPGRNPKSENIAGECLAVSPDGKQIPVPREFFTALSDFLRTRKYPGSIKIEFHDERIIGLEAVLRKKYPGKA